jgi:membrane protease YdiL (CAAX protease family)
MPTIDMHAADPRGGPAPGPARVRLPSRFRNGAWAAWVVLAILSMDFVGGSAYLVVVLITGLVAHGLVDSRKPGRPAASTDRELLVVAGVYALVVALISVAFRGFGTDRMVGMFLSFGLALVIGVAGPVYYTVWAQHRPLAHLGLTWGNWRRTVQLALLFAGVQFSITLWGYELPQPVDWIPLLFMALVVGVFESILFRGFIQARLQERWGDVPGVLAAAAAYGAYHVGYGMGISEVLFLTGLGVVYATAFALTRSVAVLWPLLTPLGSVFAQLEAGDIELPWPSIAGFADVLALMLAVLWLARRKIRRRAQGRAPNRASDQSTRH